ncbi:28S ribosomal protein S21; mitochondrial [Camelus dromedarius]|uniref:28S ribosomal protein S21 n=1 Tax=Camelus dromedarius TaxID=9838 RepID=A0A5N4CQA4_CAMDR|nr:28S ribosomal protein S21; mitochondrial [Camelus dromedarius]
MRRWRVEVARKPCVIGWPPGKEKQAYWKRAQLTPFILGRILTMDGLIEDIKRRRYYEKPCRRRQRESYETCRRIYNMEMARKINFLMRKNRADPWQGC